MTKAVIVLAFCALFAGSLAAQDGVTVVETVTGPYTFAYREFTGDYSRTPPVFTELREALARRGITPGPSIGIYLDDPKNVPAGTSRCFCGAVIEERELSKLEALRGDFKFEHIDRAARIVAEYAGGDVSARSARCYAALNKYVEKKGYAAYDCFELYDAGRTLYVMSARELEYDYPRLEAESGSGGAATVWPDPEWQVSTPEAEGMSSERLAELLDRLPRYFDLDVLDGLLIARHGKIVAELAVAPNDPAYRHEAHSVTKSVISTLVGVAIQRGSIRGLDDRVLGYFPGETFRNMNEAKRNMTLGQVLDMTSGIGFRQFPQNDNTTTAMAMAGSPDWARFTLNLPMTARPGERFNYSEGDAAIASALVGKAVGCPTLDFAKRELFGPLGITDFVWKTDPSGNVDGGNGLYLIPRDLAKIGYLYLRDGIWKGRRILPSGWASMVLAGSVKPTFWAAPNYGRFWWVDRTHGIFSACGAGGQFLIVIPGEDIVAVVTEKQPQSYHFQPTFIEIANELILPAVVSGGALPEDPSGHMALAARIARFAVQYPRTPPESPATAGRISGKAWKIEPNPLGLTSLKLEFHRDEADLTLTGDKPSILPVGLDGTLKKSGWIDTGKLSWDGFFASRGRWEDERTFVIRFLVYEGELGGELRLVVDGNRLRGTITFSDPLYENFAFAGGL